MSFRILQHATLALLITSVASANVACDTTATQEYRDCQQLVNSLRPDKAGQQRVFARDGSEFTAGQALWMQHQLHKVERLCTHGTATDAAEAARILADVRQLLKSHQRSS